MTTFTGYDSPATSTDTERTEARSLDLMQQSAADSTVAQWRPAGWTGLIRDARRRACVNLEGYFDDEGVDAQRLDAILDQAVLDVVDFVVAEVKKRIGAVDWRYTDGDDCYVRQTETRREVETAALARWPREISVELATAEAALKAFRDQAKARRTPVTDEDRSLHVALYLKLQSRVDELAPRPSDDEQLRRAMRRYGRSIAMEWITKLAFAVGGPDDAFSTVFSRSEETMANLSDAHRDEIFARHLATVKAHLGEAREAFL